MLPSSLRKLVVILTIVSSRMYHDEEEVHDNAEGCVEEVISEEFG